MTFSIVARDPASGRFGAATATGGPVVGSLVPHVRAGLGAIVTQSFTNPHFGYRGLDALAAGKPADRVLQGLVDADAGRDRRQCLILGVSGPAAAWTGVDAGPVAASFVGDDFAVAGNMLNNDAVVGAMAETFSAAADLPLEEKLFKALEAGHAAGGDYRGARSAAIRVCDDQPYPAVDTRVDWSHTPIADLRQVLDAIKTEPYASFFAHLPTPEG